MEPEDDADRIIELLEQADHILSADVPIEPDEEALSDLADILTEIDGGE